MKKNEQALDPQAHYYVKGEVLIQLRDQLRAACEETADVDAKARICKIARLVPEDPTYAFT